VKKQLVHARPTLVPCLCRRSARESNENRHLLARLPEGIVSTQEIVDRYLVGRGFACVECAEVMAP